MLLCEFRLATERDVDGDVRSFAGLEDLCREIWLLMLGNLTFEFFRIRLSSSLMDVREKVSWVFILDLLRIREVMRVVLHGFESWEEVKGLNWRERRIWF